MMAQQVEAQCKGCRRAVFVEHLDRDGYCQQVDGSPCPQKPLPPTTKGAAT